jgi:hypothetical protein
VGPYARDHGFRARNDIERALGGIVRLRWWSGRNSTPAARNTPAASTAPATPTAPSTPPSPSTPADDEWIDAGAAERAVVPRAERVGAVPLTLMTRQQAERAAAGGAAATPSAGGPVRIRPGRGALGGAAAGGTGGCGCGH